MLREFQTRALLEKIEGELHESMVDLRGKLKSPRLRAAAIWELLVIEQALKLGKVRYEPAEGGTNDLLVETEAGEKLWIEITYARPRFDGEEKQRHVVEGWIRERCESEGLPPHKISIRFEGERTEDGYPMILPDEHEKREIVRADELTAFIQDAKADPATRCFMNFKNYSISVDYVPEFEGPFLSGSFTPSYDPTTVEGNVVYRKLCGKRKQRRQLTTPLLTVIGSDIAPILSSSNFGAVTIQKAVGAAFKQYQSLSAVFVCQFGRRFHNPPAPQLLVNAVARNPISEALSQAVRERFNFAEWDYTWPLSPTTKRADLQQYSGDLSEGYAENCMRLKFPAGLLIDMLRQSEELRAQYLDPQFEKDKKLFDDLDKYDLINCDIEPGDPQKGLTDQIVLKFREKPPPVY